MASQIVQIRDKQTLEKIEKEGMPTVIYVSNGALPICRNFTPQYEDLAEKYAKKGEREGSVRFTQLDFSSETSALFKFSPNQLPVVTFISRGPWSRTMMSPNIQQVEQGVEEMLEKTGNLRN